MTRSDVEVDEQCALEWAALRSGWLEDGGRTADTVRLYRTALRKLEAWCARIPIDPLRLSRDQAQLFTRDLAETLGLSRSMVDATVARLGSLYCWISARHPLVENPFGTVVARSNLETIKLRLPSDEELQTILRTLPALEALAVATLVYLGVPVPSLARLETNNGIFRTVHRGRRIEGPLPKELEPMLLDDEVCRHKPFSGLLGEAIAKRVRLSCARLALAGDLKQGYAPRDFLYLSAMRQWQEHHDVVRLSQRLGHSSPEVTEKLLVRIGCLDRG